MSLKTQPFIPPKKAKEEIKKTVKKEEMDFLSSYYPIPCEEVNKPIQFFFTPLNLLTEKEFDNILKPEDTTISPSTIPNLNENFKLFRSIFVKECVPSFPSRLLSYKAKDQTKLNNFCYTDIAKARDRKYLKEWKGINFITSINLNSTGEILINNLSLDLLQKQIKIKTLEGKKYTSNRYDAYIAVLRSQFEKNREKIIPLQEGSIIGDPSLATTLTQLINFLLPFVKAHKIAELINTLKTNLNIKEFKKSKNFNRIYELRGETIRYFYNEKNYTKLKQDRSSVLYNSCMRHNSCYEQLKFYSNNPSSIALLVVMDSENPRQISARTILWTTVDGKKAIDRIYYNKQEDANILVTYAKSMSYETVYNTSVTSYGMTYMSKVVIHIEDPEDTGLPYFDTMHCWERFNSLLSRTSNELKSYCDEKKLNYALFDSGGFYSPRFNSFSIHGNSGVDYIRDIYGKSITNREKIIAVDLPHKGYLNNEQIQLIGYPKRSTLRIAIKFIKELKSKYNCIATAVCRWKPNVYTEYIDDKKNLVYSSILKTYIDKKESYYDEIRGSFLYENSISDKKVQEACWLRKLRSVYTHKIVSLTEEGYKYFRELNESLTVPLNVIPIRPSRKFKINPLNINLEGIVLKDITVPFKYLKTIKRNG